MERVQFEDDLARDHAGQKYAYLYSVDGTYVEVLMTISEKWNREEHGFIRLPDGRDARAVPVEQVRRERGISGSRRVRTRAKWPMTSDAAGVHPSQVNELRDHWRRHGITGVDVTRDGSVVWNDAAARKRDCESRGLYDRNGGYSDPMPRNC